MKRKLVKKKTVYLVIWTLSRQEAGTDMTKFLRSVSTNDCACIKAQDV